jgi:hypothetical protein
LVQEKCPKEYCNFFVETTYGVVIIQLDTLKLQDFMNAYDVNLEWCLYMEAMEGVDADKVSRCEHRFHMEDGRLYRYTQIYFPKREGQIFFMREVHSSKVARPFLMHKTLANL